MAPTTVEFEGRCKELEFLLHNLSGALIGKGRIVVIAGETGIGKTRLVEEFSEIVGQVGCTALVGKCIAGPPSSYLPFRDMLARTTKDTRMTVDREAKKGEHFPAHIVRLIGQVSKEGTLIIVLEDMQYADQDSTTLLHFLGRGIADMKLMIVCTYRPKEILNTGADRPHPFFETLVEMRKERLCEEMVLDPLGKMDLGKLAESILGGPLEETDLKHLMDLTGSNTLYFIETLRSMAAEGGMVRQGVVWMMAPGKTVPLNGQVKQAVLGQMDTLSGPELRVLELASVMGVDFDYTVVAEVLELGRTRVSEMLDSIETRTDLIRDLGEGYRFSDMMTRDVIRSQISPMRQRELLKAAERSLNKKRSSDKVLK